MYIGVYFAVSKDLHQLQIFALIYNPVLMFSLYISWNSTQKSRIVFLHNKLDQLNREALDIMAHTDVLTRLNNRRQFMQLANYHIHSQNELQHPTALLIFDVDRFKTINDQFGHFVGDFVLQQIADTCRHVLRSQDILARFGGEEFIILLPNTNLHQAIEIAERLRKSIENSGVKLETQQELKFTVSIGIAEFNAKNRDLHHVIQLADKALYQAKNMGRNAISTYKTAS
ncbi:GGDEF domain-containing protein [Acinetobacter sp. YH12227]|uniref:GGDEF domain-containing protein n=1 Tax=Acinetobacter sp. YH12227 TaxID=2601158 RepID=UPI00211F00F2|nr:GGDEF domain-containing protein [Acinetobacter sp. YH12227]